MVTVSLMLPLPLAVKLVPVVPVAVQVAPVKLAGNVSVTVAPTASDGPLFETMTVYCRPEPAATEPVEGVTELPPLLSVLVTERSALWVIVSLSVALLLPGVGSVVPPGAVAVAVFERVPVGGLLTVPLRGDAVVLP